MSGISTVVMLVQAIALAALMACSLGMIARWTGRPEVQDAVMGALFGLAAVVSMASPIVLQDGVIVDLRNLFIAVSTGFFGWIGGGITLGIAIGTRLGIGGVGAFSGAVAMIAAAGAGLLWRALVVPRTPNVSLSGLALGAMTSLTILLSLLMPEPLRSSMLFSVGPVLVGLYIGGAQLLTHLLTREYRLLTETTMLQVAAQTDPLTNLPNRRRTEDIVARMASRRPGKQGVAMLYFDVDRFKAINDAHGHMVGDAVLRTVTERVNDCLRSSDHLARHGGDEFVVIQTGLSRQQAEISAERCRSAVQAQPVEVQGRRVEVTISIGLHWSLDVLPFDELFERADEALLRAKAAGRNRVCQLHAAA